jgi:phage FluMu gp28-like protein
MAYKKTVGERAFNQEMENKFTAVGEEIFDQDAVDEAETIGLLSEIQFPESLVYAGVDFAMGGKDKMAVSVIEYDTKSKLFYTRFIKEYGAKTLNNERVESIIRTVFSNYPQISRMFGDQTAMGIPIIAHLKRKFPSMIVGVPFSREKKEDMLLNMVSIYHDGRIRNPKHAKLKEQLAGISTALSNSGQLVYKHRAGGHDDLVWAQALALSPIKAGATGIFATSFGSVGMAGEELEMERPAQLKTHEEIFNERIMREVMEEDGFDDFAI